MSETSLCGHMEMSSGEMELHSSQACRAATACDVTHAALDAASAPTPLTESNVPTKIKADKDYLYAESGEHR